MNKVIVVLAFGLFVVTQACKDNIVQWRGNDRNGVYHEKDLLDEWPEEGPEILWVYEGLGRGYAAPIVSNGKIFVRKCAYEAVDQRFAYDNFWRGEEA